MPRDSDKTLQRHVEGLGPKKLRRALAPSPCRCRALSRRNFWTRSMVAPQSSRREANGQAECAARGTAALPCVPSNWKRQRFQIFKSKTWTDRTCEQILRNCPVKLDPWIFARWLVGMGESPIGPYLASRPSPACLASDLKRHSVKQVDQKGHAHTRSVLPSTCRLLTPPETRQSNSRSPSPATPAPPMERHLARGRTEYEAELMSSLCFVWKNETNKPNEPIQMAPFLSTRTPRRSHSV